MNPSKHNRCGSHTKGRCALSHDGRIYCALPVGHVGYCSAQYAVEIERERDTGQRRYKWHVVTWYACRSVDNPAAQCVSDAAFKNAPPFTHRIDRRKATMRRHWQRYNERARSATA